MKLKKGDKVKIMVGKDRGREGKIEKVFPRDQTVLLPGLNVFKRHLKPKGEGRSGGIIDVSRPLTASKLALICPKCGLPTRIGYKLLNGKKVRICRKCEQEID